LAKLAAESVPAENKLLLPRNVAPLAASTPVSQKHCARLEIFRGAKTFVRRATHFRSVL